MFFILLLHGFIEEQIRAPSNERVQQWTTKWSPETNPRVRSSADRKLLVDRDVRHRPEPRETEEKEGEEANAEHVEGKVDDDGGATTGTARRR